MIGISKDHASQKGDCHKDECVLIQNVQIDPRTSRKPNTLCRCWLKLERQPQWNVSWTDMGWKATQQRRSYQSKRNRKRQTVICKWTQGQRSSFVETCLVVWWNWSRTVWTWWPLLHLERCLAWKYHHNSDLWGWQNHVVRLYCSRKNWCIS